MITIEEGLAAFLVANAGVNALISGRVYPNKLPQDVTLPAITYQRIDSPRIHAHDSSGATGTARPRMQIDCWAGGSEPYKSAKAISDAVRAALDGYRGTFGTVNPVTVQSALIQNERWNDQADAGVGRMTCDYIIWHLEG